MKHFDLHLRLDRTALLCLLMSTSLVYAIQIQVGASLSLRSLFVTHKVLTEHLLCVDSVDTLVYKKRSLLHKAYVLGTKSQSTSEHMNP